MVKSRSRSPRWKPEPPLHRSPEYNRHRQDYEYYNHGFHRNPRRPLQWDNERHRHSNSRNYMYNNFNDNMHEHGSFDLDFKRSPIDATNHMRRTYSPQRQGEGGRRFSTKYNEVTDYREHSHNFHDHRIHEKNIHNNAYNNDFKNGRRWGSFYRPHRGRDRIWHENDSHWNEHNHPDQYLSPPRRRPKVFEERNSFQKRYPEDDYREYEQPHKRAREAGRHDYQASHRSSHWKDDHLEEPYYEKDWTKEVDYRHSNPIINEKQKDWTKEVDYRHSNSIINEKQSGHVTKIEYDCSHRSPGYVHTEPIFSDDHTSRYNRHEEKKLPHARTSQNQKTNGDGQERRRYNERSSEPLPKCNSRNDDGSNSSKKDIDKKHLNDKHKDQGRKDENWKRKEDECRKEPASIRHLRPQTTDPKVVLKITPEKEAMDNFGLKKSTDKYRPSHELKNMPKDLPPKSEAAQGPRISERKQVLGDDLKNRSNSAFKDRQTFQDLDGKQKFHLVFGHSQQSVHRSADAPSTEFTQEIITIVHKVKANHFRSSGMSLHERFSKIQTESNKQESDKPVIQTNPEIHRRIDISLEELQNKSLRKAVQAQSVSHKTIQDPNDLRYDIERRRKERLHSDQNGTTNASFDNSDVSGSYCGLKNQEDEVFYGFSRDRQPPIQESTGQLAATGSYYRGNSNHSYTSQSNLEETNETRTPYKGWGNSSAKT